MSHPALWQAAEAVCGGGLRSTAEDSEAGAESTPHNRQMTKGGDTIEAENQEAVPATKL